MVARETGGKSEARAKSAIRSSKFMVRSSENSEPRTQNFRSRTSHHTYRFLHEQRHDSEQVPGPFSILAISSLSSQASGPREKRFLIPWSYPGLTRISVLHLEP